MVKKFAPVFDGGEIDVLWDHYETAITWYQKHLGLKVEQKEDWKPDPRVVQGEKTHMGLGLWLDTYITQKKLPYHFADRGTADPNIRWCWSTKDFERTHALFRENGIRITDIYTGPGGHNYFDFWATMEGVRFTIHDDQPASSIVYKGDTNDHPFSDSFVRVGVSDLNHAAEWYISNVGMAVEETHPEEG